MKFLALLILSAAGSALAKSNSTKSQCNEVAKLTKLTELAANQTALDLKTKNNATRADAIKAQASTAATKLAALEADSTLMENCNRIFAAAATDRDCRTLGRMEHLSAVAANQTELDKLTKGNTTKADALKAKVASETSSLAALQGNSTLTAICSTKKTQQTCHKLKSLQKEVDMAANQTALDKKFKGNETKIANFKTKADKAKTELTSLESNTTLTDFCAASRESTGTTPNNNAAAANSASASGTPKTTTSAATGLVPVGSQVALIASFIVGVLFL